MTGEAVPARSRTGLTYFEAEDQRTILGPSLRLTFARVGDRWSHTLAVGEATEGAFAGTASAVEGLADGDDPARVVSPAYQELRAHPFAEGIRLLLTGQATPHHFSAVVTASVRPVGNAIDLEFDIADRSSAPLAVLAATYLVALGSSDLADAGPGWIAWGGEVPDRGRLEFRADPPHDLALAEAGRRGARVQAVARLVPASRTQRLIYRWRWTLPHTHAPSPVPIAPAPD